MEIREAKDSDIPEIVSLLRLSLGETLMPKSEQYWRWKHIENPFGPSPVLLCWEGGQLIGVRAFMRWEWICGDQIYKTVRAVDTATHPDHQGKGIFKKLTLALLHRCNEEGVDFVFNTPNQQSKPGYLKMGWEEAGRLPVCVDVQRPFSMLINLMTRAKPQEYNEGNDGVKYYLQPEKLNGLLTNVHNHSSRLITNTATQYLNWRYSDVPVAKYVAVGEEKGGVLTGLIIGRIKESRLGRELRIVECFLKNSTDGIELRRRLKDWERDWNVDYVTFSGAVKGCATRLANGLRIKTAIGPLVTMRSLAMTDLKMLKKFNQWSPALGDLELF